MVLRLLIDAVHPEETRVVIADNSRIHDFDFVTAAKKQLKGNIYLAKVTRVEPSLQAAFVEYGGGKQGFLPFAEIHPDYYQIPMADRKRLLDEVEAAAAESDESDNAQNTPDFIQPVSEGGEIKHDPRMDTETLPFDDASRELANLSLLPESVTTPSEVMPSSHEVSAELRSETDFSHEPLAAQIQTEHNGNQNVESEQGQEIETLANEEDSVRSSRPTSFYRRYKIQEVIKRNQIVLVQVIKEERGNKGVSLTTFISLAGRYCVLMPNSPKGGGISRKIMSGEDRKRLREISSELKTARGMSAIIRTAGIDRTRAEIKRDFEYLVQLWDSIREQTLSSTAPALIYEEGDLIKRTLRDLYSGDIEEILVEGEKGFEQAKDFLRMILPSHAPRVKLYQDAVPLFYAYNIEDQLSSMYDPIVKLRSGGYIVLNPTEALISIDVNSGRSTGERNIEETAAKTNLEAAAEIARQLRLRDLAGLIVIDFIDMMDGRNRRAVERALRDALKLDRAKIQLGRISPFGLLEMSRQRLRPSLSETSSMPCPHCQGKGNIRSDASVAIQLIRAAEKEAASGQFSELKITVTPSIALYLLNASREAISAMEKKYNVAIVAASDDTLPQSHFRIEKIRTSHARRVQGPAAVQNPLPSDLPSLEETGVEQADFMVSEVIEIGGSEETPFLRENQREDRPRRGRRGGRGRRSGGRHFRDRNESAQAEGTIETVHATNAPAASETEQNENPRAHAPRGDRRRPRRWRDRRERQSNGVDGQRPVDGLESNIIPHQPPVHELQAPAQIIAAPPVREVPPLAAQAPQDIKPKKGWWRRIVES